MHKELEQIEANLRKNGWTLSVPAKDDEMAEYVKGYDDSQNVIGIEICLEPCSLGVYGRYGVCSVQIIKYEQPMPYIRDDLRNMISLIKNAERELLDAGVPFRPSYLFTDCTESLLDTNYELRLKYHLEQYEAKDFADDQ